MCSLHQLKPQINNFALKKYDNSKLNSLYSKTGVYKPFSVRDFWKNRFSHHYALKIFLESVPSPIWYRKRPPCGGRRKNIFASERAIKTTPYKSKTSTIHKL